MLSKIKKKILIDKVISKSGKVTSITLQGSSYLQENVLSIYLDVNNFESNKFSLSFSGHLRQ